VAKLAVIKSALNNTKNKKVFNILFFIFYFPQSLFYLTFGFEILVYADFTSKYPSTGTFTVSVTPPT